MELRKLNLIWILSSFVLIATGLLSRVESARADALLVELHQVYAMDGIPTADGSAISTYSGWDFGAGALYKFEKSSSTFGFDSMSLDLGVRAYLSQWINTQIDVNERITGLTALGFVRFNMWYLGFEVAGGLSNLSLSTTTGGETYSIPRVRLAGYLNIPLSSDHRWTLGFFGRTDLGWMASTGAAQYVVNGFGGGVSLLYRFGAGRGGGGPY